MKPFTLIIFASLTILSCVDPPKNTQEAVDSSTGISGLWNRVGTIQIVNDIPVDTVFLSDTNEGYRQIKFFNDGHIIWIDNDYDSLRIDKAGKGLYGKYKIESDSLTESISHGTGGSMNWLESFKDSLNVDKVSFKFGISISGNMLTQYTNLDVGAQFEKGENISYAELWERMPPATKETKIDGVWKRVYEINYVNNIPIDTIGVPTDGILDVHFRLNGRFIYQVDRHEMFTPEERGFYGWGGYGQYEFVEENKIMEYHEFNSGPGPLKGGAINVPPKTILKNNGNFTGGLIELEFYSDDLFQQVQVDSLGNKRRGVVYQKI